MIVSFCYSFHCNEFQLFSGILPADHGLLLSKETEKHINIVFHNILMIVSHLLVFCLLTYCRETDKTSIYLFYYIISAI